MTKTQENIIHGYKITVLVRIIFLLDRSNKSKKYLIVFESQNIDSYYFRNELEPAINFCKVCKQMNP